MSSMYTYLCSIYKYAYQIYMPYVSALTTNGGGVISLRAFVIPTKHKALTAALLKTEPTALLNE